jgi:hypothetical protein
MFQSYDYSFALQWQRKHTKALRALILSGLGSSPSSDCYRRGEDRRYYDAECFQKIMQSCQGWWGSSEVTTISPTSPGATGRQAFRIACPEEVAFNQGYIYSGQLERLGVALGKSDYAQYVRGLASK